MLEHVLAGSEAAPTPLRAKALLAALTLAYWQQDVRKLESLTQVYQPLVQDLGDQQGMALARFVQGYAALLRHPEAAVWIQLEESLADMRRHADPLWIMRMLSALGRLAFIQGDAPRGQVLLEEGLTRARVAGDFSSQAWTLLFLAHLALTQGELATAQARLEEGAALSQETGERAIAPFALTLQGLIRWRQRKTDEARVSFQEGIRVYREQGTRWGVARLLLLLAHVAAGEGDMAEARADYAESLAIAHDVQVEGFIATGFKGLGVIAATEGQLVLATRLWGAAASLQESKDASIPPALYEQAVQRTRTKLGEQAFATAWAEGHTMTPEQALAAQEPAAKPSTTPAGPSSVPHAPKSPTYPAGLTSREVEVLRLVAQGLSDAQVAEQLVISPRTVNWHLTSIYGKLGVSSRAAATRYALEHALV